MCDGVWGERGVDSTEHLSVLLGALQREGTALPPPLPSFQSDRKTQVLVGKLKNGLRAQPLLLPQCLSLYTVISQDPGEEMVGMKAGAQRQCKKGCLAHSRGHFIDPSAPILTVVKSGSPEIRDEPKLRTVSHRVRFSPRVDGRLSLRIGSGRGLGGLERFLGWQCS